MWSLYMKRRVSPFISRRQLSDLTAIFLVTCWTAAYQPFVRREYVFSLHRDGRPAFTLHSVQLNIGVPVQPTIHDFVLRSGHFQLCGTSVFTRSMHREALRSI
jgi:hypothetical protein